MPKEILKIFNSEMIQTGTAERDEVHKKGYWHEVFHCWFVSREAGKDYLYLQLRSTGKKDHPNLFDITAAGHLSADETAEDGVREIKEELGIEIAITETVPLGIMKYSYRKGGFIDNEFAHVFLYRKAPPFERFILQEEEVSGIVRTEFNIFYEMWTGRREEIQLEGIQIDGDGNRVNIRTAVGKDALVPHGDDFYCKLVNLLKDKLSGAQGQ